MRTELGPEYTYMALYAIQQNFRPPRHRQGVKCVVQFRIMKSGKIDTRTIKVIKSTGRPDLDQSAVKALERTGTLAELYDEYPEDFVVVKVTFDFQKRD